MNFCFSSDDKYVQALIVILTSLKVNHPTEYLNIHILDSGISDENKKKVLYLQNQDIKINFIRINDDLINNYKLPPKTHFTTAILTRLRIPELFPNLDRMLYLDIDMIILKNLTQLYNVNLDRCLLGMVKDFKEEECKKYLSVKNYYNSGLILFDIKKCTKFNFTEKMIYALINSKNLKFPDQDVINKNCQNMIKSLDFVYNSQINPEVSNNIKQIKQNINNTYILHYTGPIKPWKSKYNPFEEYYLKYLKLTPFREIYYKICFYKFIVKICNFIYSIKKLDNIKYFCFLKIPILKTTRRDGFKYFYVFGFLLAKV